MLIGASISDFWNINVRYPCVEVATRFTFDKSPIVASCLRERPRPSAVILKQCAAYFPLPLDEKKPLIEGWVDQLAEAEIPAALATVVPVTAAHDRREAGRFAGILEYNDWVRAVTDDRGIPRLDLEEVLRISSQDRHLAPQWATRDGLHLRRLAYRRRLDPIVQPLLLELIS